MSEELFPINFQDKENTPELLAFLQAYGENKYLRAEEINLIRDCINWLKEKQNDLKLATFTVELMLLQELEFYAPADLRINSITNVVGVPTITLTVNDLAYTLGDLISAGAKIKVVSNIESVINLNVIYE